MSPLSFGVNRITLQVAVQFEIHKSSDESAPWETGCMTNQMKVSSRTRPISLRGMVGMELTLLEITTRPHRAMDSIKLSTTKLHPRVEEPLLEEEPSIALNPPGQWSMNGDLSTTVATRFRFARDKIPTCVD